MSSTSHDFRNDASRATTPLDGVLLVGHGTRNRRGTEEFFELSDRLAEVLSGTAIVQPTLLEFQSPTIDEGWRTLIDANVRQITVAPLLLFAAGHAKSDIPDAVDAVARATGTRDRLAGFSHPISRQKSMIAAIRERLREAFQCVGGASDGRTAVVMVGRGSLDPCASSDMRVLAETTVRGRDDSGHSIADEFAIGKIDLYTTFYAMAEPRLTDTLEQISASGLYDRVIVHPHLLFSGRLYDSIQKQTLEARDRSPSMHFALSRYLGPTAAVAAAIAARVNQTFEPA